MKLLALSLIVVLALTMYLPTSRAISNPPGQYEYAIAVPAGPRTVDPAKAYDIDSGELIFNVYETVLFFKGTSFGDYVPMIASDWGIQDDGLTYWFKIRTGMQWQNPAYGDVTPQDVEYSWERVMVLDYVGGPGWMFYQPILGTYTANDTGELSNPPNAYTIALGQAIDSAITSNATHVVVHFATGKAYQAFPAILAQTWGSVLSRQWCIDQSDWPGTGLQDGTWVSYHAPETSKLDSPAHVMMGSGPYKFDYWISTAWSLLKFDDYWAGWGNTRRGYNALGYISRVTEYFVPYWPKMLEDFLPPYMIYDTITVPRSSIPSVWQQPGVKCIYPFGAVSLDGLFFTYDVGASSPYIGDGNPGTTGIPHDFFSDVHARKAMAYSFNWTKYISTVYMWEGMQNPIPVPDSFKFYNGSVPGYYIDIVRAEYEWAQAWTSVNPGGVMATGMSFNITYNQESTARKAAAEILRDALNAENPLFHVTVQGQPWATYLNQLNSPLNGGRSIMPTFIHGWQADFPDMHNWVGPFMASWGDYGFAQHIDLDPYSQEMDNLINWGWNNLTDTMRAYNYNRLFQLYVQQVPNVPLVQGLIRRWQRDWVHGWYYNAMYPGEYIYPLWKQDMTTTTQPKFAGKYANWEDITEDGKVDIKDLAVAAKAFGAWFLNPVLPPWPPFPPPPFPPWLYTPNWDSRADLNPINPTDTAPYTPRGDMKIDIKDLAALAKLYGFVADPWTPPP